MRCQSDKGRTEGGHEEVGDGRHDQRTMEGRREVRGEDDGAAGGWKKATRGAGMKTEAGPITQVKFCFHAIHSGRKQTKGDLMLEDHLQGRTWKWNGKEGSRT